MFSISSIYHKLDYGNSIKTSFFPAYASLVSKHKNGVLIVCFSIRVKFSIMHRYKINLKIVPAWCHTFVQNVVEMTLKCRPLLP